MIDLTVPLDKLSGDPPAAVAVVGDIMLDRYFLGSSDKISPEAPVPVVLVESEMTRLGGSGNVVANLRGLDAEALPVGIVGSDAAGRRIRSRLEELGCRGEFLLELSDRPTTEKTRVVAQNQQVVRIDREESEDIEPSVFERLSHAVEAAFAEVDVCVLSDYGKGVCTDDFVRQLITRAREAGVSVIVDPKGRNFEKYRGASAITPNLKETRAVVPLPATDNDAVVSAARDIARRFELENVLITRSSDGMTLLADSEVHHFDARAQEVYDVSGAGDTVVATLAAGLASGSGYRDAAALANVAAGIVVGKLGTASIHRHEIEREIARGRAGPEGARIATLDQWRTSPPAWWNGEQRVVLLDGFVEEMNGRTVQVLDRARELGDVLVVLAWSEPSRSRSYGLDGHVAPAVLAGIAAVEHVGVLDSVRPERHLARLRPDVVVRSACFERRPSEVSEAFLQDADVVELPSGVASS